MGVSPGTVSTHYCSLSSSSSSEHLSCVTTSWTLTLCTVH